MGTVKATLEQRVGLIEDRQDIQMLVATHPLSADTADTAFIERLYTADAVFDRGPGLSSADSRTEVLAMMQNPAHRAAIAGGLAHIGTPPLIELDGDAARAISYTLLVTPDKAGRKQELPNHGTTTGYRIHRALVNRWSFQRTDEGWRVSARVIAPADGAGPALDLIAGLAGRTT